MKKLLSTFGNSLRRGLASVNARWGSYEKDPIKYWNLRHGTQRESLDGVGQIGLGHDANLEDYEEKWRRISVAMDRAEVSTSARVLDAGCGIGWISERLLERGHAVTCVDFSEEAVRLALQRLGSSIVAHVQPLDQRVVGSPFDTVICIDVLFHVVDDATWAATVGNLADMCSDGGTLVIQENLLELADQAAKAEHVRWRTLADYRRVLPGWHFEYSDRYLLPNAGTTKDIMVWKRLGQSDGLS